MMSIRFGLRMLALLLAIALAAVVGAMLFLPGTT